MNLFPFNFFIQNFDQVCKFFGDMLNVNSFSHSHIIIAHNRLPRRGPTYKPLRAVGVKMPALDESSL